MHRGETSRPLEKTGLRDGSRFHAGGEAPTRASVMFSPGPSPCIIPHRGSVGLDVPKLNPCEAQCRKFGKMTLPAELLRISCLPFCLPQSWKRLSRLWEDSPPNFSRFCAGWRSMCAAPPPFQVLHFISKTKEVHTALSIHTCFFPKNMWAT